MLKLISSTGLALGLALTLGSASPRASSHPHHRIPLLTYSLRCRHFLDGKSGAVALHAIEQRLRRAFPEARVAPAGAFARKLRSWAQRGQVDLVQLLLARHVDAPVAEARLAEVLRACRVHQVLVADVLKGDPLEIAGLPRSRFGMLPVTSQHFLGIRRGGAGIATRAEPADASFAERIRGVGHRVPRGIGFQRLDLDGDGWPETERIDGDDDRRFDAYHVDRDADGVFELAVGVARDGSLEITAGHGRHLELKRRTAAAVGSPPKEKEEPR